MGSRQDIDSGRLVLDRDVVRYDSRTYESWELAVADIRVIGEMTNQCGPFADDYFVCFVTDASGCWKEASFYAEGLDACLTQLGAQLGSDLQLQLCASTDFTSRVVWPPQLVGDPMFEFREKVPHGLWQKLKRLLLPENLQTISKAVMAGLRPSDQQPAPSAVDYAQAHRHAIHNRPEVLSSDQCGCFHCLHIFAPKAIKSWVMERDGEETALCPACGIDAVIGSAAGFPLTNSFLADMKRAYFES
jgi:hypothetical protein